MMINKDLKMENRLKEARFFAKIPQIKLWLQSGIHYSTISRIECGYIEPTDDQKRKLAKALGVEKTWLFPKDKGKNKSRNAKKGRDHGC